MSVLGNEFGIKVEGRANANSQFDLQMKRTRTIGAAYIPVR